MTDKVIYELPLPTGKFIIGSDDVGCWFGVDDGHGVKSVLVTSSDLDTLRHGILINDEKIRKAERPKVPA